MMMHREGVFCKATWAFPDRSIQAPIAREVKAMGMIQAVLFRSEFEMYRLEKIQFSIPQRLRGFRCCVENVINQRQHHFGSATFSDAHGRPKGFGQFSAQSMERGY
jgi:hypothetical protein